MKSFLKAGPQWSGFFLSGVAVGSIVLTSCQVPPKPPVSSPTPAPVEKKGARNDGPTRSYIGLGQKEAMAKASAMGLRSRTVRDGPKRFPITKDLRADRINFEIDNGLVTSAKMF